MRYSQSIDQKTLIYVGNYGDCLRIDSSFPLLQYGFLSRRNLSVPPNEQIGILSLAELIKKIHDEEIVSKDGVIYTISKNVLKDGYSASLFYTKSVQ